LKYAAAVLLTERMNRAIARYVVKDLGCASVMEAYVKACGKSYAEGLIEAEAKVAHALQAAEESIARAYGDIDVSLNVRDMSDAVAASMYKAMNEAVVEAVAQIAVMFAPGTPARELAGVDADEPLEFGGADDDDEPLELEGADEVY
jgi:hypothetical protein